MNHAVRNFLCLPLRRFKFVRRRLLLAAICATALAPVAVCVAQESPTKPKQATPVLVHDAAGLIDASAKDAGKSPPDTPAATSAAWEKLIYVPYRALKNVLTD